MSTGTHGSSSGASQTSRHWTPGSGTLPTTAEIVGGLYSADETGWMWGSGSGPGFDGLHVDC